MKMYGLCALKNKLMFYHLKTRHCVSYGTALMQSHTCLLLTRSSLEAWLLKPQHSTKKFKY